jgi:HEAT repeat protein
MKRIVWLGVLFGLGLATCHFAFTQTQIDSDELTLKSHRLPTDTEGLLTFFRKRSLKEGDAKNIESLVRKLGSNVYREREPAAKELISYGSAAIPFLKTALVNSPLEMKRRAELCIREIENTMQSEPISAAARYLASKKHPDAALVLLNFVPSVGNDPFLEEEVLAAIGRLTIQPEKADALILDAVKDPSPHRRVVAAYLLGRRGGPEYRTQLRELLNDPDMNVRLRVAEGLFGKRPAQMLQEALVGDEKLLREQKVGLSEPELLKFFADKTLNDSKQKHYRSLIKSMGSNSYVVREQATRQIIKEGTSVLAFLKDAEFDPNVELSRRARTCLEEIRRNSNTAIPIAAAHLLARPATNKDYSPGEAIRTLLAYIPFADDDSVEEEILTSLTLLSLRETKVEPDLLKALSDPNTTRRGAAAYVLGHVGTKDHIARLPGMLNDVQPLVRLRTAQGLVAARDKSALPTFVNLLTTVPGPFLPRVEEVLYRIAEDKGPNEAIIAASGDSREKAAKAWGKWLNDNQAKIDLSNLNDRESYLGLITVAEYDNQVGQIQGQVWEGPRGSTTKRWNFTGVMGAMDAQTLPNGRVLVAENNANRVTERDSKGDIKWEFRTPNNPIVCQRLPNGNTFIASYNMVMEIKPDRTEAYRLTPGPQFYIFSAHKARNGNIVAITAQGQIIEMETPSGKQVKVTQAQTQGNWCSVEMLPNGNYLVASLNNNMVREIDRNNGAEVWSKPFPGVFRATRLPNGNILVASMNTKEVAEMDRAGTIRWRVTCQGRPWGIHYR